MTAQKRYTTATQRALLESVGMPHRPGRSYEEAQDFIQQCIDTGVLPRNALDPPTERQIAFIEKHRLELPIRYTKAEASEAIGKRIELLERVQSISPGQLDFIRRLGGIPYRRMTYHDASEFIDWLLDRQPVCRNCGSNAHRGEQRCDACGAFLPKLSPLRPPPGVYTPSFWEWLASLLRC